MRNAGLSPTDPLASLAMTMRPCRSACSKCNLLRSCPSTLRIFWLTAKASTLLRTGEIEVSMKSCGQLANCPSKNARATGFLARFTTRARKFRIGEEAGNVQERRAGGIEQHDQ